MEEEPQVIHITSERKDTEEISSNELVPMVIRVKNIADAYFSGVELAESDRALLIYFTKLALVHELHDVPMQFFSEDLENSPKEWGDLIVDRARGEKFLEDSVMDLKELVKNPHIFALGLLGKKTLAGKLQDKMTETVDQKSSTRKLFNATHV